MKNRTNQGMHFDESTARAPILCCLPFRNDRNREMWIRLLIPARILDTLNTADLDYIRSQLPQWHREHMDRALLLMQVGQKVDFNLLEKNLCETVLQQRAADALYDEFIVKQAKIGNEAWQVPPTMQRISPNPDLDDQHADSEGVIHL